MIRIIDQDLFKANVNTIIHQANCLHTMGAGVARIIRMSFPKAYLVDTRTPFGDIRKLGTFSKAHTQGKWIYNLYGQFGMAENKERKTSYDALAKGFNAIRNDLLDGFCLEWNIGIPYGIGCGLGGGNWNIVLSIIQEELDHKDFQISICKI
jgi:O-acetyl-ADP-ribose deacetylase (regulator of RNase III)